MLRIAICDGDMDFLDGLSSRLHSCFQVEGCTIKLERYSSGLALIEDIERHKLIYDVIFLDIELPTINGTDVAKRLRSLANQTFLLVFTTNLEHKWSEGYKYEAFRYILKRRIQQDLTEAVSSIIQKLKYAAVNGQITFKYRNTTSKERLTVNIEDILYFEKKKTRRISVHTTHGEYELLVKPLTYYKELIASVAFDVFVRSYLVNMAKIETCAEDSFVLSGDMQIPLGDSRKCQEGCKERYLQFLSERI